MPSITETSPQANAPVEVEATVTSKGQVTIPAEIRKRLMAKAGDKLTFTATCEGVTVSRKSELNVFDKYRGAWGDILPAGYEGREGVVRYVREMRGHDESDDLIFGKE